MKKLPTWTPEGQLVHIGTMDPSAKGVRGDSYEGHGISVSECPEAWESIARLGGQPWWALSLEGKALEAPRFLDWHRVTTATRAELVDWAAANGWCVPTNGFKVSWYDSDHGGRVYSTFEDRAKAVEEFEIMTSEYEGEASSGPTINEFAAWKLTAAALAALSRKRADLDETPLMAALLYGERETSLTGVYWADRLDPACLSAPRAVIFPGRLAQFSVAPYASTSGPVRLIAAARAGSAQVVSDRWLNEHEASDACRGLVTVPNPARVGILDAYLLCAPEHPAAIRRREQLAFSARPS